jgi:hypothetical protein
LTYSLFLSFIFKLKSTDSKKEEFRKYLEKAGVID